MATVPPVQPPTPPPPVISSPTSSMNTEEWQKVKEPKSSPTPTSQHSPQRSSSPPLNTPNTHLATVRAKLANATNRDRLGRPLLYNKLPGKKLFLLWKNQIILIFNKDFFQIVLFVLILYYFIKEKNITK